MNVRTKLENAIENAIDAYLTTDKKVEEAKIYFEGMLVNDMIDMVLYVRKNNGEIG